MKPSECKVKILQDFLEILKHQFPNFKKILKMQNLCNFELSQYVSVA